MKKEMKKENYTAASRAPFERNDAIVFAIVADSFCNPGQKKWDERFGHEGWRRFVRQSDEMLRRFGTAGAMTLGELLPPDYTEHTEFYRCHFTEGKLFAVLPLEALYRHVMEPRPQDTFSLRPAVPGVRPSSIEPLMPRAEEPGLTSAAGATGTAGASGAPATAQAGVPASGVAPVAPSVAAAGGSPQISSPPAAGAPAGSTTGASAPASAPASASVSVPLASANGAAAAASKGTAQAQRSREVMLMSMGAQLAQMSSERPDHLSVMLDFLALLVCNGLFEEAQLYLCEHLEWLPRYKRDLLERAPFAWFYAVLLDVLIRLRASDAQQAFVRAVQQRQRQLYGQVASFG